MASPASDSEPECSICRDCLKDPTSPSSCRHVFCRSCLTESMRIRPHCPLCRAPANQQQLIVPANGVHAHVGGAIDTRRARHGEVRDRILRHGRALPLVDRFSAVPSRRLSTSIQERLRLLNASIEATQNAVPSTPLEPFAPPTLPTQATVVPVSPSPPQVFPSLFPVAPRPHPVLSSPPRLPSSPPPLPSSPPPVAPRPPPVAPRLHLVAPRPHLVVPTPQPTENHYEIALPFVQVPVVPPTNTNPNTASQWRRHLQDESSPSSSSSSSDEESLDDILHEYQMQQLRHNSSGGMLFACPYCQAGGLDELGLLEHCNSNHMADLRRVVCPICVSLPHGDPTYQSVDFIGHINLRHRFYNSDFMDVTQNDAINEQAAILASYNSLVQNR